MELLYFACIVVSYAGKPVAHPVNKKFLAGLTFLRKHDFFAGRILPFAVLGTETAVTVSVRVFRPVVILPDVLEIDLAA